MEVENSTPSTKSTENQKPPKNSKSHPHPSPHRNHFQDAVETFVQYRESALQDFDQMEENFKSLDIKHKQYIQQSFDEKIQKLRSSMNVNHEFLCHVVERHVSQKLLQIDSKEINRKDVFNLRSILRHLVRDWSKEGSEERNTCYNPIISRIQAFYPNPVVNSNKIKILIPGCGLSRLVFELACLGYAAQGSEISFFMILTSEFILNDVEKENEFDIFPYIHNPSNLININDAFAKYSIPDVSPGEKLPLDADISIIAGDFLRVYCRQNEMWDSVVTCFFLDTARNVIQYIELIHKILKVGGVWINLGPLCYHHANSLSEFSVEFSWEELKHIITAIGFVIEDETLIQSTYAEPQAAKSMKTIYNSVLFTAIKKK